MESQNLAHDHIVEVGINVPAPMTGGTKIYERAICGFSDDKTNSKDAKERSESIQKLVIAVILRVSLMKVEIIGGIKANSLAILTDAAHLLSDAASFAISLFSLWASGWEGNPLAELWILQD